MVVLACILLYLIVGALTGGYIQGISENSYGGPDTADLLMMGIFWPFTWFWFGFLKPVSKIGGWVARKRLELIQSRIRVRQAREQERRLRIAEGMPEVEEFIAGEENTRREPMRAHK